MGAMASQITSLTIVYSTVYSDADQRKHQSSASLAFVWWIHRRPVNSLHKWPVTRKMFPFDDVIMIYRDVCSPCDAFYTPVLKTVVFCYTHLRPSIRIFLPFFQHVFRYQFETWYIFGRWHDKSNLGFIGIWSLWLVLQPKVDQINLFCINGRINQDKSFKYGDTIQQEFIKSKVWLYLMEGQQPGYDTNILVTFEPFHSARRKSFNLFVRT